MAKKNALGKGMASLLQVNNSEALLSSLSEGEQSKKQVIQGQLGNREENHSISSTSNAETYKAGPIEPGPILIDITQIKENPYQPRRIFKEEDLSELSESIKENGIIQPIIVTECEGGFELIAGERRLRAAKKIDLKKIPAIVRRATDRERLVLAIIENVQRSDLNCVEEGLAYYQLMDEFKLTQEEVAKKVGKERSTVANFLRILKLPRPVIDFLKKELLSFGHAKILASLKDSERIKLLAEEVVQKSLSVRELETLATSIVDENKRPKSVGRGKLIFNEKLDQLKQNLEKKTGFHVGLNMKKSGSGQIIIKFGNESEFNTIYDFLLK